MPSNKPSATGTQAGSPAPSGSDSALLAGVTLETGDFPKVQGRGRPADPLPADLVKNLEASLKAGFATYFGDEKSIARIKAKATRWATRHDPALKVNFVSYEKDGQKGIAMKAIAMKAKEVVSA